MTHEGAALRISTIQSMDVNGRMMAYRLVSSKSARRLRIRVGLDGVEVVHPAGRAVGDIKGFLAKHCGWISEQMERVERLRVIRLPKPEEKGMILFRGLPTPVRIERISERKGPNRVTFVNRELLLEISGSSRTSAVRSLENWLRKQSREAIIVELNAVTRKVKRTPNRVYVMGQRTKWGNCSTLLNLSFSWRLIMLPEYVMRYLVTHEAVHLAVPDHSSRFWLTVQSLCPDTERAKQWLSRNGGSLPLSLDSIVGGAIDQKIN